MAKRRKQNMHSTSASQSLKNMSRKKKILPFFILLILFKRNFLGQNDYSQYRNLIDFATIFPKDVKKELPSLQNITKTSSYRKESTRVWLKSKLKNAGQKYDELYYINTEEKFVEWLYEDLEIGWENEPDGWLKKFCPEVVKHFQKFPLAKKSDPGAVLFSPLPSSKHAAQSVSLNSFFVLILLHSFFHSTYFSFLDLHFKNSTSYNIINKCTNISPRWIASRSNFTWTNDSMG